jgi:succinoglycan biosynthesis protein ExoM
MFVSVVIPTYRRTKALGPLILELGAQIDALDGAAVEIVVVDNCPDRSAEPIVAAGCREACYVNEPRPGVVHARNAGIRHSTGRYIIFIDDDQQPVAGWLESYCRLARLGHAACFGPVKPSFEEPPQAHLRPILEDLFSRNMAVSTGTDITDRRAYLGTGNSMFERARCFPAQTPFDVRFNRGGEDVWFLRELVQVHHLSLTWCAEASVFELVPAVRMNSAYVRQRRYRNGQLRCLVEFRGGNWAATGFWMSVGAIQTTFFGLAGLATVLVDRPRAAAFGARAAGGLGKIFWWLTGRG